MLVFDYSYARPNPQQMRNAGVLGVCRYVSPQSGKNLSAAERDGLFRAGIAVALVWENAADDALHPEYAADQARAAVAQAQALGYPRGAGLYNACDFDVTAGQWNNACRAYYQTWAQAVRAAGYRSGIYGPYDALDWAFRDGSVDLGWQCTASYAWSQGRSATPHPRASVNQYRVDTSYAGISDIDLNSTTTADWGQWLPGTWPATNAPEEDSMHIDLELNKPYVISNPGNANGHKSWAMFSTDFGTASIRVATWSVSHTAWTSVNTITVTAPGDVLGLLLDGDTRKISVVLTSWAPGTGWDPSLLGPSTRPAVGLDLVPSVEAV